MIGLGSDKNNLALALGGEVQWSAVAEVKNVDARVRPLLTDQDEDYAAFDGTPLGARWVEKQTKVFLILAAIL